MTFENHRDAELVVAMDLAIMAGKKSKLDFLCDRLEQANLAFDDDPSWTNKEGLRVALFEMAQFLLPFATTKQ
jgi:hypothetical protein